MRTWSASRSACENTATEAIPCSRQARITRTAISPRFATRTLVIFISSALAPLEARAALFPEGLHALPVVRGLDEDRLAEALERPGGVEGGARAALDHPLGEPERLRRLGGEPGGERAGLAHELGIFHAPVHQTAAQRLVGADDLARQHELLGAPEPDQLDEPGAASDARDEPEVVLGQAETRRARGDPKIAGQRQLEPPADARAVDRGDERLLESFEIVEEAREQPPVGAEYRRVPVRLERRHVGADAERLAGAREHHHPDRLVRVQLVGQDPEVGAHLHRDRVVLLGTVDGDDGDPVRELVLQRCEGHALPSGGRADTRHPAFLARSSITRRLWSRSTNSAGRSGDRPTQPSSVASHTTSSPFAT